MSTLDDKTLAAHAAWKGKLNVTVKAPLNTREDLSLAYTPGVAAPCLAIKADPEKVYEYTWKSHTVAVITDGSAVLGLGNIGPKASLPVMEGKCALFKQFADIDAVPIALDTQDPDEIIRICQALAPSFGGFNLEDISAPRCVLIERALKETLDIPVFHDDQHGTAIVVAAGLMNALKLVHKSFNDLKVVVSGAGAAGSSILFMLKDLGVTDLLAFNKDGILRQSTASDFLTKELTVFTNPKDLDLSLAQALVDADVFIGVSAPDLLNASMVASMAKDPIVFALANPIPEISVEDARAGGARIIATGRSDYPNQINNVLVFPGLFKGALKAKAQITQAMKIAAAKALADLVEDDLLSAEYIIPSVFDLRVADTVASAVQSVALSKDRVLSY